MVLFFAYPALVSGSFWFNSDVTDADDNAAQVMLLPLPEGEQNFVHLIRVFSNCPIALSIL